MTPAEVAEAIQIVLDTTEFVADATIVDGEPDTVGVETVDGDVFFVKVESA
jgi:hypothetical protein